MLLCQSVIRHQDHAQGILPQGKIRDILVRRRDACRQFFFVFFVELRDDLPEDLGGLIADIALLMNQ